MSLNKTIEHSTEWEAEVAKMTTRQIRINLKNIEETWGDEELPPLTYECYDALLAELEKRPDGLQENERIAEIIKADGGCRVGPRTVFQFEDGKYTLHNSFCMDFEKTVTSLEEAVSYLLDW